MRKKFEIAVISDVHLGTYGCHATELLSYLKSIEPKVLILNGDIIDIWQFSKLYWPDSHMAVLKEILNMLSKGVKVYYLVGNHDEVLRKFGRFSLGNISIQNKLVLNLDGKKAWFFHGDIFDVTMQHSKWLAKLGGKGYDLLILINRFANYISQNILDKGKISLSKKIKNSVKSAVSFISNFEETCAEIAIENNYFYVVCGHIHQPEIKEITNEKGSVTYLNSGDWVENLTALEYNNQNWKLVYFSPDMVQPKQELKETSTEEFSDINIEELISLNPMVINQLLGFSGFKK